MKRLLLPALVGAVLLSAAPVLADDGFYVISTRATPGTCIIRLPYTITAPGYYYLNRNLTYTSGDGITVNQGVNNVTIDLMGFVLTGPSNNNYCGISLAGNNDVEVRNGTVTGWQTGVRGGGINQRAIGVRAVSNTLGILLGTNALIKDCTATQGSFADGHYALYSSGIISGCTVYNFKGTQWVGNGVSGPVTISGGTASDNVVIDCAGKGIRGWGPATISRNAVFNCDTGISHEGGGSIVGNAVKANAGQIGIDPPPFDIFNLIPSLLDQNSVNGDGLHYGPGNTATVWGLNGGRD